MSDYLCPIHIEPLRGVLPGGAGHCGKCGLYVQALGVEMPTLPPEIVAKREAAQTSRDHAEAERQRKKKAVKEGVARLKEQAALEAAKAKPKRKSRRTKNATTDDSAQKAEHSLLKAKGTS